MTDNLLDVRAQKKILRRKFLSERAIVPRDERDGISRELVKKFLATSGMIQND